MDNQGTTPTSVTVGEASTEDRLAALEADYRQLVEAVYEIGERVVEAPGSRVQWVAHLKINNIYNKIRFR